MWGCRTDVHGRLTMYAVKNASDSRTRLERRAAEGKSPVYEIPRTAVSILSNAGHVKPGMNLGRPLSKAKYSLVTDSGLVP